MVRLIINLTPIPLSLKGEGEEKKEGANAPPEHPSSVYRQGEGGGTGREAKPLSGFPTIIREKGLDKMIFKCYNVTK
jgi:hypothetical protein